MSMILPIISTALGAALTAEDWNKIGVNAVSVYLEALLVRPGLDGLKKLSSLGSYIGWRGDILLNASNMVEKNGVYTVRSPFDGSQSTYSEETLIELVLALKPTYLVLPASRWYEALAHSGIQLFLPSAEIQKINSSDVGQWLKKDDHMLLCAHPNHKWKETEKPMQDASQGIVYRESGEVFDIRAPEMAMTFRPLAENCICEACEKKLTIAYFHHLFEHTPGLCQRFLMQHNFYIFKTYDSSAMCG